MTTQLSSFSPEAVVCCFFILPFRGGPTCIGVPPLTAARMAARRCFARSSPASAAFTYQTLASRMSLRHPMPISVK